MKRRSFIRTSGTAALALSVPMILPAGRLFASTGNRLANHVVLCIPGGGIRNQETIEKSEGNLMPNLFRGNETISGDIAHAMTVLPGTLSKEPIQTSGTLFRQFRYAEGPTSHVHALNAILTGKYSGYSSNSVLENTLFYLHQKSESFFSKPANSIFISGNTFGTNDLEKGNYAEKMIEQHSPELMIVHFEDADVCHSDFTVYCDNLRKADHAIAGLWSKIQGNSVMKDNTVLIVVPEHGRNANPNFIADANGRFGIDHFSIESTGDQNAREIFCLIAGPSSVIKQNQEINRSTGESIEILPAISRILGFENRSPKNGIRSFEGSGISEAFV